MSCWYCGIPRDDDYKEIRCIDCKQEICEGCEFVGPSGSVCESCADERNSRINDEP